MNGRMMAVLSEQKQVFQRLYGLDRLGEFWHPAHSFAIRIISLRIEMRTVVPTVRFPYSQLPVRR